MNKIAVLDCDSICFSIGNPKKIYEDGKPLMVRSKAGNLVFATVEKTEEELRESANLIMTTILRNCGATHYLGFIKGNATTVGRRSINPDYKANRKLDPPIWWEFVKRHLIEVWKVQEVHGIEVDDMINITRLNIPNSFIVAIDGDLLGLEGTHFKWRLKDSLKGEWITVTDKEAEYKFWCDMIAGQTVDNIRGIPRKGEKYFEKLVVEHLGVPLEALVLLEYIEHFGEMEGISEYYKNYTCLKILESKGDRILPEPIPVPEFVQKIDQEKLFVEN